MPFAMEVDMDYVHVTEDVDEQARVSLQSYISSIKCGR